MIIGVSLCIFTTLPPCVPLSLRGLATVPCGWAEALVCKGGYGQRGLLDGMWYDMMHV